MPAGDAERRRVGCGAAQVRARSQVGCADPTGLEDDGSCRVVMFTETPGQTPTPTPTPGTCDGDLDGDWRVTIAEIIRAVRSSFEGCADEPTPAPARPPRRAA